MSAGTIRERLRALGIDNGPNGLDDDVRELLSHVEVGVELPSHRAKRVIIPFDETERDATGRDRAAALDVADVVLRRAADNEAMRGCSGVARHLRELAAVNAAVAQSVKRGMR